jgi:hypothetical protein
MSEAHHQTDNKQLLIDKILSTHDYLIISSVSPHLANTERFRAWSSARHKSTTG